MFPLPAGRVFWLAATSRQKRERAQRLGLGLGGEVVGDGRVGRVKELSRETRWDRNGVHGRWRPEEPPGGSQSVRSSEESGVMPVEPRPVREQPVWEWKSVGLSLTGQGTQGSGGVKSMTNDERNRAAAVAGASSPSGAAAIRHRWWWVDHWVWPDCRLTRLEGSEPTTKPLVCGAGAI